MKIKVCGMRDKENIEALEALQPDYMGLIFYDKSARNVEELVANDLSVEKVGVFVNASDKEISQKAETYNFKIVQLHGSESPEFCEEIKGKGFTVIKAFSIDNHFDFSQLEAYKPVCDLFLFDTKGKLPGGNGSTFDWEVLDQYDNEMPFILSGGIGLEHHEVLKEVANKKHWNLHAIDVNSKFETAPAMKDMNSVKEMIEFVKKEL